MKLNQLRIKKTIVSCIHQDRNHLFFFFFIYTYILVGYVNAITSVNVIALYYDTMNDLPTDYCI